MSKVHETLKQYLYEGWNKSKKKPSKNVEKSRDFYGKLPRSNRVVPFVSEREYQEYIRES